MKKKYLLSTVLIFNFFFHSSLSAQQPGGVKGSIIRQAPVAYNYPAEKIESSKKLSGPCTQWIVFSDRPDNPTYKNPKGSEAFKKMEFMQAFYVIDEKDNYLRIVRWDAGTTGAIDFSTNMIKTELEDYGWVPKEKLLLWKSALVGDQTRLMEKALLINPEYDFKNPVVNMKVYADPGLKTENNNISSLADFFYIYKKEGEACLVGNSTKINNPALAAKQVPGWISKKVIQEWNNRVAAEPNRVAGAVQERRNAGIAPLLFSSPEEALSFKSTGKNQTKFVIWNNESYDAVKKPGYAKFPVLQKQNNGLMKLALMSNQYDLNGVQQLTQEEQYDIENKYQAASTRLHTINLIFVADGSLWMKDYFPVISKAISACSDYITEENYDIPGNYKIGSVIYRDYSENNCPDGTPAIEKLPLNKNFSEAARYFMDDSKAKDCKEQDKPRAVYAGINEAIKMLEGHKGETNVIILIGSAGNTGKDRMINKQSLINALAENNCSLFAFRVKSQPGDIYYDFISQSKELMMESAKLVQSSYQKSFPGKPAVKPEFKDGLVYPKTSPLPGSIAFAEVLKQIPPDTLIKKIVSVLEEMNQQHKEIISNAESTMKKQAGNTNLNEAVCLFLSTMGLSPSQMQQITSAHKQSFQPAYAPAEITAIKKPLFKYTLLLSEQELSDLVFKLKQVISYNMPEKELRKSLMEIVKCLAEIHLGYDLSENNIDNMTDEGWLRLYTKDLPFKSPLLTAGRVNLSDFESSAKINSQALSGFIESIREKVQVLEKMQANEQSFFLLNGQRFCWVSEDYLP